MRSGVREERRDLAIVTEIEKLLGTTSDPTEATRRLREAQKRAHLLSPALSVGALPEGAAVSFAMALLDPATDCYQPKGSDKFAPLKHALATIALNAGISWLSSKRTDDGEDATYWAWHAEGEILQLDCRNVTLMGSSELDLREGSETRAEIEERQMDKARTKAARDRERRWTPAEIATEGRENAAAEIRQMLARPMRTLETKTMHAVIRQLGLKQAYSRAELEKPFVIVRLQWTGRSSDPATQREFSRATAAAFFGSRATSFGTDPSEPAVIDVPATVRPADASPKPEAQAPAQEAPVAAPPRTEATQAGSDDQPAEDERDDDGFDIDDPPAMGWKGKPFTLPAHGRDPKINVADCTEADSERLAYWIDRNEQDFKDGLVEDRYLDYTKAKLAALQWKLRSLEPW